VARSALFSKESTMTDTLPTVPANARVEEVCDYCRRSFSRAVVASAICPSCGLVNVRPVLSAAAPESAMLTGAPEQAILPAARPRRRAPRKKSN
jgi:hypothetical protein